MLFPDTATFFFYKVISAVRLTPTPKPKFPRLNRINIPMAKERCVPQRRCNHVVPAEATQAYEIERWAESLDGGSGQPPLPYIPQLYPTRPLKQQKEPREGNWVSFDSAASCQVYWVSSSCVPHKVESLLQKSWRLTSM